MPQITFIVQFKNSYTMFSLSQVQITEWILKHLHEKATNVHQLIKDSLFRKTHTKQISLNIYYYYSDASFNNDKCLNYSGKVLFSKTPWSFICVALNILYKVQTGFRNANWSWTCIKLKCKLYKVHYTFIVFQFWDLLP